MYRRVIALSLIFAITACSHNISKNTALVVTPNAENLSVQKLSETEQLNRWFEKKYSEKLLFSPIMMTFLGKKESYDKIDSMTEASVLEQLQWRKQTVVEMESLFDYNKLTEDAKLSYNLWKYQYEEEKRAAQYLNQDYVFHQMNGVQAFLPQFLINFHKVDTPSDIEAYIARIGGVARAMNELLVRAKIYAGQGIRPPKFAYEAVREQAGNILAGEPFEQGKDSPLWADINTEIDNLVIANVLDKKTAEDYRTQAKQALLGEFNTAYQSLITWINDDLPQADTIATGVGKRSGGEDYYNYQLESSTTTKMTAQQIHELGLTEVERLTGEMERIKNKVGYVGTLQSFFKYIKQNDAFYYPNTDEGRLAYINDAEQFLGLIKQQLPIFFGRLPKADLIVKRVEAFREQDGAAQHYYPGTADGSRPGIYYAHLSDMRAMPKNEMEAIAYHEGLPGHHMQISIAKELEFVPEFRKQANFTAYAEGWALYSEFLAKEMGAYQNDYSDFGRLITEMWRAVRLVVDTGLHAKGWTEESAVAYFKEKTPIAEGAIQSEVRRYIVWPGQATAYKIGMLKIQELRVFAEQELGEEFDIRGFHDAVLDGGSMPLSMLENKIKGWIAAKKSGLN